VIDEELAMMITILVRLNTKPFHVRLDVVSNVSRTRYEVQARADANTRSELAEQSSTRRYMQCNFL
jgi:hypothetical protein